MKVGALNFRDTKMWLNTEFNRILYADDQSQGNLYLIVDRASLGFYTGQFLQAYLPN